MRRTRAIRLATQADVAAVRAISDETGLSDDSQAGSMLELMDKDHTWIVLESQTGDVIGAAYFGPESHSDRVWNLYFLAVAREHQRGGLGSALVDYVEADLRRRGDDVAKLLLIETSSVDTFAPARAFYRKQALWKKRAFGSTTGLATTRSCSGSFSMPSPRHLQPDPGELNRSDCVVDAASLPLRSLCSRQDRTCKPDCITDPQLVRQTS